MNLRTRAADLPELDRDPAQHPLDGDAYSTEGDYAPVYADEALALEMAAARAFAAAEASQEGPDELRLRAEYDAQRRARAANSSEYAPTDAELAADESISAVLDGWRDGDLAWLSEQVEQPEHFAIAARAA